MRVDIEVETAAEDILAKQAGLACLGQGRLETLVGLPELATDVVVPGNCTDRITADDHALDQGMRVVAQDIAILEGTRLALVRIAHHVAVARCSAVDEAPLEPRRETRTATTAQTGFLYRLDDLFLRDLFAQDLLQCLVATLRLVGLQPPGAIFVQGPEADFICHGVTPGHPGSDPPVQVSDSRNRCARSASSAHHRRRRDIRPP